MKKTTPAAPHNVLEVVPELANKSLVTFRLHPRRGQSQIPVAASKMGGVFRWPHDYPWPQCEETYPPPAWLNDDWPVDEDAMVPLVPVLQLFADEIPGIEFPPGTDTLQVLWCPLYHEDPIYMAKPAIHWWHRSQLDGQSPPITSRLGFPQFFPLECELFPEAVKEFPSGQNPALNTGIANKIHSWKVDVVTSGKYVSPMEYYVAELSVCPGTKIGGDVNWLQTAFIPTCQCGRTMQHLITIAPSEFPWDTRFRWCPLEDQPILLNGTQPQIEAIQSPAGLGGIGGYQYIFVCRECVGWPIQSVYQA